MLIGENFFVGKPNIFAKYFRQSATAGLLRKTPQFNRNFSV